MLPARLVAYLSIAAVGGVIFAILSIQSVGIGSSQAPQSSPNYPTPEEEMAEDLRQDAYSEAYEAEFVALEAKESTVRGIVYADERIHDHIEGKFGYQDDLIRADLTGTGTDELLIYVVGERLPIEGHWKTSYKTTYTGIFELKVSVKDGQVVSIEKIPKDDVTDIQTFTDSEKNAIEIAFANQEVASAIERRDITVVRVMAFSAGPDCPPQSCVNIFLEQQSKGQALSLFFNTSTSEVIKLNKGEGW